MDFRYSKLGLDKTFTLCGNANYAAPEQVSHAGHGQAVDFWHLGVFLYELLMGQGPFQKAEEDKVGTLILVCGGCAGRGYISN